VLLLLEVGEGEGLTGGVPLPLSELLPLLEAEAPAVRDAVGEEDKVEEADTVLEGVTAAVSEPERVMLPVGVEEGD